MKWKWIMLKYNDYNETNSAMTQDTTQYTNHKFIILFIIYEWFLINYIVDQS